MLYAQGKINVASCASALASLPNSQQYVKKNAKGEITSIDLPKFLEVDCNLVRSFVTRRHAAQCNKYNNLWPYYKYEARSTGMIGKLRADVTSQAVDIMADQFGWRHHDNQVYRDMLLYARSVDFVRASWECYEQIVPQGTSEEFSGEEFPVDTEIVREGVAFVNPHPSRVFYDNAYPLSSINTDSGCEFIGYWDVVRYREIADNPLYWNRDSISFSPPMAQIFSTYSSYFTQYYTNIAPPPSEQVLPVSSDISGNNDRKNNVGVYNGDLKDSAVIKSEYFRKLIPKHYGIGDYPHPVWVRFITASDRTVVYAEFLPSSPAAYYGFNESDHRQVNLSFAHEVMPYQDQMSNLLRSMLHLAQIELTKVFQINSDALTEEQIKALRAKFEGQDWNGKPIVVEYSAEKALGLGQEFRGAVTVTETHVTQSFEVILRAMAQLVQLAEKLNAMSPAEQGQPAPREISATEVNEISATTSSVYTFISDSIDFGHSAKKRIAYESMVCCKKGKLRVPVLNRYSKKTVESAGFEIVEEEDEDYSNKEFRRRTVLGTTRNAVHDYIFTTRDGAERPVNTQAANALVQLLAQLLPVPTVLQAMGKEKLYNIVNEIFRMSGAGLDLNLEMREGDDDTLGVDQIQQMAQMLEQLQGALQQLAEATKQNSEGLAQQEQVNKEQQEALNLVGQLAQQVKSVIQRQEQAESRIQSIADEPPRESLSYKDAPPSVRVQMEAAAGYTPASEADHRAMLKPKAAA